MQDVRVSAQTDCDSPTSLCNPTAIALTLNGDAFEYDKEGNILKTRCLAVDDIDPFKVTLFNTIGHSLSVSGNAANTGTATIGRTTVTFTMPNPGNGDEWTVTATPTDGGPSVEFKTKTTHHN